MSCKYWYIDDDMNNTMDGIIRALNQNKEVLEVIPQRALTDWEKQWDELDVNSFDGLILDLRLCDATDEDGKRAEFNGATLAQEIRSRQRDGLKSFPLVLLSANDNLQKLLNSTSFELFDYIQSKGNIDFDKLSSILLSLYKGYEVIRSKKDFSRIIGIDPIKFLNRSFVEEFTTLLKKEVYEISNFLINHLILRRGLLIEKEILLARLGVDKNSPDLPHLLNALEEIKYKGAFGDGWERWWMPLLEDWWDTKIDSESYFRSLTATKRVELLKEKLGIQNLQPISKIENAVSESFWTVCKGTGEAIDTIDGLILADQNFPYSWQEKEYISIKEALEEEHRGDTWKNIAGFEKDKLEKIKAMKREEQKRKRR